MLYHLVGKTIINRHRERDVFLHTQYNTEKGNMLEATIVAVEGSISTYEVCQIKKDLRTFTGLGRANQGRERGMLKKQEMERLHAYDNRQGKHNTQREFDYMILHSPFTVIAA